MRVKLLRDASSYKLDNEKTARKALLGLLLRDAAVATEWIARRQSKAYTEDSVARQKKAQAYIEWCEAASHKLQQCELVDNAEFIREWRVQATRSDIRDIPHRFRWIFGSQLMLAIAVMLFIGGLPLLAMPLLAGAIFGGLHIYLVARPVIVGPDRANLQRSRMRAR